MSRTALLLASVWMLATRVVLADDGTEPPTPAPANAPIEVSGRVIDALGRPVRGAILTVENQADHVTSDKSGRFTLTAALGATLVVTAEGKSTELATVTGATLDDIVLLLDVSGEQIEIRSETPIAAPGAAKLDREEIQRLPGTGGDIVRALTAMPGVVNLQVPLGFSGVVIRGSSPQDSKFLVDDFEIPLLFHALGIRAVMPVESIESMTLIPGGFDVSYGRASSGIVQLTTRPGSATRSTQAEVSLVDGGFVTQGSVGKKTRYMIALRRSLIDFLLPHVIPSSVDLSLATVPQYWDEQLRVDHEISSHWNVTLSSLGTDDVFELYTTKDESAGAKRFYTRTRFIRLTGAAKYHSGEWTGSLALSGMLTDLTAEVGLYQHLDVVTPLITPRVSLTRSMPTAMGLKNVVWTSGAEAQVGYSSVDIALPLDRREGQPLPAYDPKDNSTHFDGSVWFPDYAAWTSVAADYDPRIRITTGLRADYFTRPDQLSIQPRAELRLQLSDTLVSRSSAGEYRRPPEYNTEFLTKTLEAEQSRQLTTGLEYSPILGVRVQGTLYYTDRSRLIAQGADGTLANTGRGTTKGAELLAMIHGGTWLGWLGYSYAHSTRVDTPGSAPRLFDYDQPHSLNVAGSWKHGRWQLGGRFQLYAGLPYTPVVSAIFDNDRNLYIPTYGAVNSERAPFHHEVDIRIDYSWKWGRAAMLAFLDVQNVYLNESIVTYFYGYDYTQRSAFVSLPLIPSAGIRAVL